MGVDGLDWHLDFFHLAAVGNWSQFNDSVQRHFDVRQLI